VKLTKIENFKAFEVTQRLPTQREKKKVTLERMRTSVLGYVNICTYARGGLEMCFIIKGAWAIILAYMEACAGSP